MLPRHFHYHLLRLRSINMLLHHCPHHFHGGGRGNLCDNVCPSTVQGAVTVRSQMKVAMVVDLRALGLKKGTMGKCEGDYQPSYTYTGCKFFFKKVSLLKGIITGLSDMNWDSSLFASLHGFADQFVVGYCKYLQPQLSTCVSFFKSIGSQAIIINLKRKYCI